MPSPHATAPATPVAAEAWHLVPTGAGWLLVVATERGLVRADLADGPAELLAAPRHPGATPTAAALALAERWARELARRADGALTAGELPLDVSGTPFERRVWEVLRAIPAGAAWSYAQVAAALGAPRAARAVARACARNPVALATPCHRVVRGDGTTGGYRWGAARKAALLARERDAALARGA